MADAAKKNLLQRINHVQQQVDYIQREQRDGMRYKIVSHDAVTALCRPHLVEAGVVYFPVNFITKQEGNRTEVVGALRFVNIDDPEDYIDVASMGYGVDKDDKGPGKAISYLVKYGLLKCLGLETGDDPDLDQTEGRFRSSTAQRAESLENAIVSTTELVEYTNLVTAPETAAIMNALAQENPSEFKRLRSVLARHKASLTPAE